MGLVFRVLTEIFTKKSSARDEIFHTKTLEYYGLVKKKNIGHVCVVELNIISE